MGFAEPAHAVLEEGGSLSWVLVAEEPFFPATSGGRVEQAGMWEHMKDRACALVLPIKDPPTMTEMKAYAPLVPILVPRQGPLRSGLGLRPFITHSRVGDLREVKRWRSSLGGATGVVSLSYKSWELSARIAKMLDLPVVVRPYNIESKYTQTLAEEFTGLKRLAVLGESARIWADERRMGSHKRVRHVLDISATDAQTRAEHCSVPVSFAAPFAGALRSAEPVWSPDARHVVFIGSLDVRTNVDALSWFIREAWRPAELPEDTKLLVVGRNPGEEVRRIVAGAERTELHSNVPDPGVLLRQARVAVNPRVSGSGSNIKLIDYLAAGVPVVTTRAGADGIQAGSDAVLAADTPNEFAAAVQLLLTDARSAAWYSEGGLRLLDRMNKRSDTMNKIERAFTNEGGN